MSPSVLSCGIVLLTLVAPAPLTAQRACRPADATAAALLSELSKLSTDRRENRAAPPPAWMPPFQAGDMELIADDSLCHQASLIYQRELHRPASAFSGRVHVVRLGRAYAVLDPRYYGPKPGVWTVMLLDAELRPIGVL